MGLSVKDLRIKQVIPWFNSFGDLYIVHGASPSPQVHAMIASIYLWLAVSDIPTAPPRPRFFASFSYRMFGSLRIPLCVNLVRWANMVGCHLAHLLPLVHFPLSFCIVICGNHLSLMFLILNFIL